MFSEEQIAEWKSKHGKIYKINLGDCGVFVYKTLTKNEYQNIMIRTYSENIDADLEVIKLCVLNTEVDEKTFEGKDGYVMTLSEAIMTKSGFVNVESEEL